ncbi:hypothetical protein CDL15_Pgr020418 [Punica granatum]|uniref:Uncharacterized protein n=1 Tax=Punica granatum TaxID=22663 RepID=A0A218VWT6_PUNGR|nr:hypothetical protein CDL15_Pgr020418 [Punica granatum]PKI75600.1 hypothetical protein CRG98_004001 [Punica granatum]
MRKAFVVGCVLLVCTHLILISTAPASASARALVEEEKYVDGPTKKVEADQDQSAITGELKRCRPYHRCIPP